MYFAHVHSHLNYGLSVWGSMLKNAQLEDLRKVQTDCIALIIKSRLSKTRLDSLMNSMNILSIDQMLQLSLCKLGFSITHKLLPRSFLQNIRCRWGKKDTQISNQTQENTQHTKTPKHHLQQELHLSSYKKIQ